MYESATLPVVGTRKEPSSQERLSIVVPVFNEAKNLPEFLKALDSLSLSCDKELILVNDCSSDGSRHLLEGFNFESPAVLIHHDTNRGKGAAIRSGLAAATGTIVGIQDADFEYDMLEIDKVIEPLLLGQADVVYGSRYLRSGMREHRSYHYLVNRFLTFLSNTLSGLALSDMETCYKFFRRDIIANLNLESARFGFEPEVTAKVARLNLRLREIPISYRPRTYGQGKKITWKDGLAALWHILRFNYLVDHKAAQENMPKRYRKP